MSSPGRGIDVCLFGRRYGAERAVIDRRRVVEGRARSRADVLAADKVPERAIAKPAEKLVRLRNVPFQNLAHACLSPSLRRFTYSCRLFFLKLSSGWNSWIFSEIANGDSSNNDPR